MDRTKKLIQFVEKRRRVSKHDAKRQIVLSKARALNKAADKCIEKAALSEGSGFLPTAMIHFAGGRAR